MAERNVNFEYFPATPKGPASPAVVYLASLGSNRSRQTQKQRLDKIARLLTGGL